MPKWVSHRCVTRICLGLLALFLSPVCPAVEYEVGPGKACAEIEDVPWEALRAGDTVTIHWRENPYPAKFVLCARGTRDQPIQVRGVPNSQGILPVIDGRDAVTRKQLNYWNEVRGVIKIGGANRPPDTTPAYITVENLDIRSARPPYVFTGRDGRTAYSDNAAAIFIEKGEFITIRGCVLRDSGNGLFIAAATRDAVVEGCYIHNNGIEGSYYQHNTYTAAAGLIYQFNRFGRLRPGCGGNNLKDRSAGLVVRYNWIEDGFNAFTRGYKRLLNIALDNRLIVVLVALIVAGGAGLLFKMTKTELSPLEDRGVIFGFVSAPEGSTSDYLMKYVQQIEGIYKTLPETNVYGGNGGFPNVADGTALLRLKDWNDRSRSQADVAKELMPKFQGIARIFNTMLR